MKEEMKNNTCRKTSLLDHNPSYPRVALTRDWPPELMRRKRGPTAAHHNQTFLKKRGQTHRLLQLQAVLKVAASSKVDCLQTAAVPWNHKRAAHLGIWKPKTNKTEVITAIKRVSKVLTTILFMINRNQGALCFKFSQMRPITSGNSISSRTLLVLINIGRDMLLMLWTIWMQSDLKILIELLAATPAPKTALVYISKSR